MAPNLLLEQRFVLALPSSILNLEPPCSPASWQLTAPIHVLGNLFQIILYQLVRHVVVKTKTFKTIYAKCYTESTQKEHSIQKK